MGTPFYKSGGFAYISEETNQALVGHDYSDRAASRNKGAVVPCRSLSKVSPDRQPSCVSIVDPERPGWYLTHHDGYLYFEPEYNPPSRDTFDNDTSFFVTRGRFFPGFATLESLSHPGYFIHTTTDDKLALSVFGNTPQFRSTASEYPVEHTYKSELTQKCVLSVPLQGGPKT